MTTDLTDRYIDGRYLSDSVDWHEGDAEWKAHHIVRMLRRTGTKPATICDIGCGSGGVIENLQRQLGDEVVCEGYDISPQAIAIAEKKSNDNLRFYCKDFFESDSHRYDLILLIDVFEHIPDYLGFLIRCKPFADTFIFHIPLELSALWVLREWPIMRRRKTVGHLHHFSKATALETLTDCGYAITNCFYTASGFYPPDHSLKSAIRNFPNKLMFRCFPDYTVRLLGGYSLLVQAQSAS